MFFISKDKSAIQIKNVEKLLKQTEWANTRKRETIKKSIENSLCYGVYLKDSKQQIGFARVITDYATTYYITDVVIDEDYRGQGIGKALVEAIVTEELLKGIQGILKTTDAFGLYSKYGFVKQNDKFMGKKP